MNKDMPRKKASRPGNKNRKLSAWQKSLSFAEIGRSNLKQFHLRRARYPKCGALAKSTGEPCRQLAMANGRCRLHGGVTPSGSEWGLRQLRPKPRRKQRPDEWLETERKLQKWKRDDDDRMRRLRQLTDEQFFAYVRRMGRRLEDRFRPALKAAVVSEFRRRGPDPRDHARSPFLFAGETKEPSPERLAIEAEIDGLKMKLAEAKRAEARKIPTAQPLTPDLYEGVFG